MLRLVLLLLALVSPLVNAYEPIQVVTEHLLPYQGLNNKGEISGANTLVVTEIFGRAALAHQIHVNDWAVSYHQAKHEKNTCIYSLVRTQEREALFHWIAPLSNLTAYFYSLKEKDIQLNTFEDSLNYRVAAVEEDVSFYYLINKGFVPGENLYKVNNVDALTDLLVRRADSIDLVMLNDELLEARVRDKTLHHLYRKHADIVALDANFYLACNLDSDIQLINKLKQAAASDSSSR